MKVSEFVVVLQRGAEQGAPTDMTNRMHCLLWTTTKQLQSSSRRAEGF